MAPSRRNRRRRSRRRNQRGQIFVDVVKMKAVSSSTTVLPRDQLTIPTDRAFQILAIRLQAVNYIRGGTVIQLRVLQPYGNGFSFTSGPLAIGLTTFFRSYRMPAPRPWWPMETVGSTTILAVDGVCDRKGQSADETFVILRLICRLSNEQISEACPTLRSWIDPLPVSVDSPGSSMEMLEMERENTSDTVT